MSTQLPAKTDDVAVVRRVVELFYYGKMESAKLFPQGVLPELHLSSTSYWLVWPEKCCVPVGQRGRGRIEKRDAVEAVKAYCLLVQRLYPDAMGEEQRTPRGWQHLKT